MRTTWSVSLFGAIFSGVAALTGCNCDRWSPRLKTRIARAAVGSGGPTASEPRIEYRPRPDATPEGELAALAAVYCYLLDLYEERVGEEVADGAARTETGLAAEPLRHRLVEDAGVEPERKA